MHNPVSIRNGVRRMHGRDTDDFHLRAGRLQTPRTAAPGSRGIWIEQSQFDAVTERSYISRDEDTLND